MKHRMQTRRRFITSLAQAVAALSLLRSTPAAAATALIRFKANIVLVVIACALAGLVRLALPAAA